MFGLKKRKERKENERREMERKERQRCGFSIEQDRIMFTRELENAKMRLEKLEREKVSIQEEIDKINKSENPDSEILKDYQEKLSFIDKEIASMQGAIKYYNEKLNNVGR